MSRRFLGIATSQGMIDKAANFDSERQKALASAITDLYATFARYKLDETLEGYHCSFEYQKTLRSAPLRRLTADDLERLAFKALTTIGTLEQFKHFLPRLLELVATEGTVGLTDLEIVLGKLSYGEWERWPRKEQEAVQSYLMALWRYVLGSYPSQPTADTTLCGIGAAVSDLRPYLDAWRAGKTVHSLRHLADFVDHNLSWLLKRGTPANAFWSADRDTPMRQIIEWLRNPALALEIEEAFFNCQDPELAESLSHASERLGWVSAATC